MNKLTTLCCIAFASLLFVTRTTHAQQQPNVLWILPDGQRYDSIQVFNRILDDRDHSEPGYVESLVTGLAFRYRAAWTGSYQPFFFAAAALNALAVVAWWFADPRKPLGTTT